ncbi:MAG: hypothetical protein GX595_21130 [Lentisphaerae bacterium]|nr:hypothetical protein [Lentisphaerota bacterium]
MKVLVILLLIIAAVILFALFGPAKPEAQPALQPAQSGGAQPTVVTTPAPAPAPAPQARPAPPPVGGLSPAAQATGVTTETVDVGGGGATFEAKRRMTGKIRQLPGGKNP